MKDDVYEADEYQLDGYPKFDIKPKKHKIKFSRAIRAILMCGFAGIIVTLWLV